LKPTEAGKAREESKVRIGNEPAVPLYRQTYRQESNRTKRICIGNVDRLVAGSTRQSLLGECGLTASPSNENIRLPSFEIAGCSPSSNQGGVSR
jgi:hypothetical protein